MDNFAYGFLILIGIIAFIVIWCIIKLPQWKEKHQKRPVNNTYSERVVPSSNTEKKELYIDPVLAYESREGGFGGTGPRINYSGRYWDSNK